MIRLIVAAVFALTLGAYPVAGNALERDKPVTSPPGSALLSRGRYLVVYGGCNNCHTPGWRDSDGKLPEAQWLTGNSVGFRGNWGTSYPANLRLEFQTLGEDQWAFAVRTRGGHPPMTWQNLRILSVADRHAIYTFIKHLGRAGVPAPAAIPPWREPVTRYIDTRPRDP